jgi:hypothetical protein
MEGNATITGNSSMRDDGEGGGVSITSNGIFYMLDNATVTRNTTRISGGGVYIDHGTLSMEGNAIISRNTASRRGGGIYLSDGIFTMQNNSAISGNTAPQGGGIYIRSGTFTKTGGNLFGNDAPATQRNIASERGSAIFAGDSHYRNSTAGPTVNTTSPSFWAND